jgi:hypothetical protein
LKSVLPIGFPFVPCALVTSSSLANPVAGVGYDLLPQSLVLIPIKALTRAKPYPVMMRHNELADNERAAT